MSSSLVAFSLGLVAITIASGFLAAFVRTGPMLRSAVLHLAAGVIFAVVAVEFLPDLMHRQAGMQTALGFALGTAVMLGIREFSRRAESRSKDSASSGALPLALLFGVAVDMAIDGLMLGIGFLAGGKAGALLAVALAFELGALGLATGSSLLDRGLPRIKVIAAVSVLAALFGVFAVFSGLLLRLVPSADLAAIVAFGVAALLYLVIEELLTEVHEGPENPWLTSMFFLGFIALFLLDILNQ